MAKMMQDMFAEETASPKGGESAMKAAADLDTETEGALVVASPSVTLKAQTVKALRDALNKVMPMFEAPLLETAVADLKDEPLPLDLVKALQMINAAHSDYAGEDAVDLLAMDGDKGVLIEVAKLGKAFTDKGFIKFLKSSETRATEAKEETMEEDEGEEEDDAMMMSRMMS